MAQRTVPECSDLMVISPVVASPTLVVAVGHDGLARHHAGMQRGAAVVALRGPLQNRTLRKRIEEQVKTSSKRANLFPDAKNNTHMLVYFRQLQL